jgi:predicted  nucleic acid-binding Zn-ribbon protein
MKRKQPKLMDRAALVKEVLALRTTVKVRDKRIDKNKSRIAGLQYRLDRLRKYEESMGDVEDLRRIVADLLAREQSLRDSIKRLTSKQSRVTKENTHVYLYNHLTRLRATVVAIREAADVAIARGDCFIEPQ